MANMIITSAGGILSLLDDREPELHIFALKKLNTIVDEFWPEISEAIQKIEVLYENEMFTDRQLAALVASKVYYHLGAFEESLTYALGAGELFDVNLSSEYVETIIAKCIDHYTKLSVHNAENKEKKPIDPRLETIVNRMFQRCFHDSQFRQAVGIAVETRRMDIFKEAILKSDDVAGMLSYSFKLCMSFIQNRTYRNEILLALVNLYKNLDIPDYVNMCQCLIFVDDAQAVADLLEKLCKGTNDQVLMAYQIAFDLYESATQQFLALVLQALKATAPIPSNLVSPVVVKPDAKPEGEAMDTDAKEEQVTSSQQQAPAVQATATLKMEDLNEGDRKHQERIEKLATILCGEVSIGLNLQFLIRNNHTDMLVLKQTKDAVRNSVCHTATVISNSFMHCGTTSDQFLRDNLEWLARATNWAKFSATASLGVIHKGHEKEALHLMSSYLPKDSGPAGGYTEGGGLYALGLIHANHGAAISDYLLEQLKGATNETVKHGAGLGLGLAAMGTQRQDIYEQLKFNMFQDDAITGEAAGVAMGLVMLGSNCRQAIEDLLGYATETQHEKILRGIAIGLSLIVYGRLEEADTLIESLSRDKDPLLRRSAMHTIAMAYCGSGNNKAIRKLLHFAVSDVNDDVRRAAVEALGFILFRTPEQCPSVVSLLSESYNPHVRYGAAMALGISCAGSGNKDAIALLEPMVNDPVNYVRQGALISSALILIQQTEQTCSKVKDFRQLYSKVIADKHDDIMAKFGAIIAQGIIDAGGRNVSISLQSRTGHTNMAAVVGMLVFAQFWNWFPLAHFLSLAFTPTAVVGLNADLKMPKMKFKSNAKPSLYAYPPPLEEKKERKREKVTTAVLSITAKAKKKKEVEKKEREEKMDVDEEKKDPTKDMAEPSTSKEDEKDKGKDKKSETETPKVGESEIKDKKEEKKELKPNFEMLTNPARAMRQQGNQHDSEEKDDGDEDREDDEKPSKKQSSKGNKKNKKEDADKSDDEEPGEESDEGDFDDKEVDYITSSSSFMQLFIRNLCGKIIVLNVKNTDTIYTVKNLIHEKEGILSNHQQLVYTGKHLHDCRRLCDYGIDTDSTLHLLLRMQGGLKFFVKKMCGIIVEVEIQPTDTAEVIQDRIQKKAGIIPDHQKYIVEENIQQVILPLKNICEKIEQQKKEEEEKEKEIKRQKAHDLRRALERAYRGQKQDKNEYLALMELHTWLVTAGYQISKDRLRNMYDDMFEYNKHRWVPVSELPDVLDLLAEAKGYDVENMKKRLAAVPPKRKA